MNPVYALMESPHRWAILAGLSFAAGSLGAIFMLNYGWSHALCRGWFYIGLLAAAVFASRGMYDWYQSVAGVDRNNQLPTHAPTSTKH